MGSGWDKALDTTRTCIRFFSTSQRLVCNLTTDRSAASIRGCSRFWFTMYLESTWSRVTEVRPWLCAASIPDMVQGDSLASAHMMLLFGLALVESARSYAIPCGKSAQTWVLIAAPWNCDDNGQRDLSCTSRSKLVAETFSCNKALTHRWHLFGRLPSLASTSPCTSTAAMCSRLGTVHSRRVDRRASNAKLSGTRLG